MKKNFSFLLLIAISLIFLTGCVTELVVPENGISLQGSEGGENPVVGIGSEKGTLKLYLTNSSGGYKDPPGSFDEEYLEINISISRIEGHIADDEEGEVEVEKGDGYWETLMNWEPGYEIDLMDIENVSVLLASLNLESNKYTQLRIFFDGDVDLVLERDGEVVTENLDIPSSDQTGIKLNHTFEIVEGMLTKLTILFDAEQSVVKKGNGEYLLKPVIELSSETYSNEGFAEEIGFGSISGNVSAYISEEGALVLTGIGGASIELTGGTYICTNTTTTLSEIGLEGNFSLDNVPSGSYTLNINAAGFDQYSENIEVTAGSNTDANIIFLSGGVFGTVKETGSESVFIEGAIAAFSLTGGDVFNISTSADENGEFIIEQLPTGTYDLFISAEGYDDYSKTGIILNIGEIIDLGLIELELNELPEPLQ